MLLCCASFLRDECVSVSANEVVEMSDVLDHRVLISLTSVTLIQAVRGE